MGIGALAPSARGQSVYDGKLRYSSTILQAAQAANASAESSKQADDYLSAVQQVEKFLSENGDAPPLLVTYPVLVTISAAHLEAAYDRIQLAERLPDYKNQLALHEQNQALVNAHLTAIPGLLVSAQNMIASSSLATDAKAKFRCDAIQQLASGAALHGIVNRDVHDLDTGIRAYASLDACGRRDQGVIRQLQFIRSNMSRSLLSPDNVVAVVSTLVEKLVPHGDLLSLGLRAAYDYLNDREAEFSPPR